jgi:hypothetical protein
VATRLIGVGVEGFRGWPDPEERRIRYPDSGSGHTLPRVKAKGAGALDPKSMEACIKICYMVSEGMVPVNVYVWPCN